MNRASWLRVSEAASCLILALSILTPFLQVEFLSILRPLVPGPEPSTSHTYWSFKTTYTFFTLPNHTTLEEYWLQDYWHRQTLYKAAEFDLTIDAVLIPMLVVQALTLIFAALAVFRIKPIMSFSAAILSLITALLMWLTSRAFTYPFAYVVPQYAFQPGFWLALTAAVLFIITFFATRIKRA